MRLALHAAIASLLFAVPTHAADLRIALSSAPSAMDPHFHNLGANLNVAANIFDTLVRMDADSKIEPGLAESWKLLDERTWEFKLRAGATFHDGSPLTADDVIFSLDRPTTLVNSPAGFAIYTKAIAAKSAPDAHTLRITTTTPYPLLLSDLSTIAILNRKAAEGVPTEDFARGRGMIGTGPYQFVSFLRDDRVELARKLAPHAQDPSEIERVLDALVAEGWQSDDRYVQGLVHRKAPVHGVARVTQELRQQGIDEKAIAEVRRSLRETELDRATEVWRKRFGSVGLPADPSEYARQGRFLATRGFSHEVIHKVLRHVFDPDQ